MMNNTTILKERVLVNVHFSKMENLVAKGDNIDFIAFDEQVSSQQPVRRGRREEDA